MQTEFLSELLQVEEENRFGISFERGNFVSGESYTYLIACIFAGPLLESQ